MASTDEMIKLFRTLYLLTYNDPRPFQELSSEFFFVSGEILEGVSAKDLELHKLPKDKFIRELSRNT